MKYSLSHQKKISISQNLIAFMKSTEDLSEDSATFIGNWILTDASEKGKAYYDVWDLVLKNYLPSSRPVLYRSCRRRKNGKIASFTGRIFCAEKFSGGKGFLLVCDTNELSLSSEMKMFGEYRHSFFSIVELLKKESQAVNCKFSKRLIDDYIKEDEYIMQIDLDWMYSCKWYQERGEQSETKV